MTRERLYLFDTTLRDGAQTQGVDFSVEDKRQIALLLDAFGIDYIEGGWPGANPTDTTFFGAPPALKRAKLVAFGMTKKLGRSASNDPGLARRPMRAAWSARRGGFMSMWHWRCRARTILPRSRKAWRP
jgi:2-isopropylmalate synthase